jgi:hypothetical protein
LNITEGVLKQGLDALRAAFAEADENFAVTAYANS